MRKVLAQISLALLLMAGSIVILSKQAASALDAVDLGYSSGVVVTDRSGYFIVTMGQVNLILTSDPG